jgi:hypothetical protein
MTMNFRKNIMTGLIGLALLATPIVATAQDRDSGKNESHPAVSQPHRDASAAHNNKAPARSNETARKAEPRTATRNEARDERNVRTEHPAPAVAANRDSRDYRNDRYRSDHNGDRDYRNYGDRGYDGGYYAGGPGVYVMPYGYAGGACAWAQHLRNVYYQDRNTGHPAAAADLLGQLHNAELNCGGVPYGYGYGF